MLNTILVVTWYQCLLVVTYIILRCSDVRVLFVPWWSSNTFTVLSSFLRSRNGCAHWCASVLFLETSKWRAHLMHTATFCGAVSVTLSTLILFTKLFNSESQKMLSTFLQTEHIIMLFPHKTSLQFSTFSNNLQELGDFSACLSALNYSVLVSVSLNMNVLVLPMTSFIRVIVSSLLFYWTCMPAGSP